MDSVMPLRIFGLEPPLDSVMKELMGQYPPEFLV